MEEFLRRTSRSNPGERARSPRSQSSKSSRRSSQQALYKRLIALSRRSKGNDSDVGQEIAGVRNAQTQTPGAPGAADTAVFGSTFFCVSLRQTAFACGIAESTSALASNSPHILCRMSRARSVLHREARRQRIPARPPAHIQKRAKSSAFPRSATTATYIGLHVPKEPVTTRRCGGIGAGVPKP